MKDIGYKWTDWELAGSQSPNFYAFSVYIIRCWSDKEEFYKIGKTFVSIGNRFLKKESMPYEWSLVRIFSGNAHYISALEKILHKGVVKYSYLPKKKFSGMNECFDIDKEVLNVILNRDYKTEPEAEFRIKILP